MGPTDEEEEELHWMLVLHNVGYGRLYAESSALFVF
jgi:hypothetical protein